jgi:hypothetical protein
MRLSPQAARLVLLIICGLGLIFLHFAQFNHGARTRLNLLLVGHPFAHLVDPVQVQEVPPHFVGGFMGVKLAYASGEHIGFIDKYANFWPVSASVDRYRNQQGKAVARRTALLLGAEILCGLVLVFLLCRLVVSSWPRRSAK